MSRYFQAIDRFASQLAQFTTSHRLWVLMISLMLVMLAGSGGRFLDFSTDYRDFFSESNPELQAFDDLQNTYSKNDNILFVLKPKSQQVFSNDTLAAVEWLTEASWQIPYTQRVDSLSNFQHTRGVDDDLIVEDLVTDARSLSAEQLDAIEQVALHEPLIHRQLVNDNQQLTAVVVTLNFPQQNVQEVPEAVAEARSLKAQLLEQHPEMDVYISGVAMLNNAFAEAGFGDMGSLVPLMFLVIMLMTWVIMRSFTATLATLVVVMLSSMFAMGLAGYFGIKLTPIAGSAPTIILTLAIADSLHILITLKNLMRDGMEKSRAIIEAVRVNFLPVTITSLTTIIGFLALNFSDSPPFWHLGNITAMGIFAAWILSLTLLPVLISWLPFRVKPRAADDLTLMDRLGQFVVRYPKQLIAVLGLSTLILISFIPRIELNDQWSEYFDDSIQFRQDTDEVVKHFGIYPVEFSLPAKGPNQIADPEYLAHLERFSEYLKQQEHVTHVYAFSDIIKRLNKNLHADDPDHYAIPDNHELAAQYLLLYEMSLPFGLDLNDRVNIDKSATRVTATLANTSTAQTKIMLENAQQWIQTNLPDYMHATLPTSAQVMFTYIAERNVFNMVGGTVGAIVLISLILMVSLMSWRLGLLSLIPNGLPILATFGTWALLVGEVGFSVATVASISLGIIVDDTVHFLSKYVRARNEKGLDAAASVQYAYRNVGLAILVNTAILTVGFLVLTTSSFKINFDMGMLTAIAIVFALLLDFLLLPALLVFFDRKPATQPSVNPSGGTPMKPVKTAAAMAAVLLFSSFGSVAAQDLNLESADPVLKGHAISARSDRSDRGFADSEVDVTMVLKNAAGQETARSMTFTTLEVADEDLGDKSLVLFNTPKDVEGTALLSHAKMVKPDDQWLFLPALKRVKRISSKNKSGPFVGSEFAFEDFTATELNKYDYLWLRTEACGDLVCDVVQRTPRYEHSGYTKQIAWIDQTDHQLRQVEFYDRRDSLLKTLTLSDYRSYDGIWRSHRLSMLNHTNGKSTDLHYGDYTFKVGLGDHDFVKGKLTEL
ncbi:outer membrane lipoprotein-sorting protein [Marinicella meishanensis]|uniref:outer membrane lipoprotein-sorting protein n=1 Tax=Marinicella meishanensis TaxID=2873263 RepID=UPI001CBC329C|nr:outer membrane lipoprotein-sorting protein [Marinicella sp. NBU2979]